MVIVFCQFIWYSVNGLGYVIREAKNARINKRTTKKFILLYGSFSLFCDWVIETSGTSQKSFPGQKIQAIAVRQEIGALMKPPCRADSRSLVIKSQNFKIYLVRSRPAVCPLFLKILKRKAGVILNLSIRPLLFNLFKRIISSHAAKA